jgi:hypothetical protein
MGKALILNANKHNTVLKKICRHFGATTLTTKTFSQTTLSIMKLRTIFSIRTFNIKTLRIKKLRVMTLNITVRKCDTQHNDIQHNIEKCDTQHNDM